MQRVVSLCPYLFYNAEQHSLSCLPPLPHPTPPLLQMRFFLHAPLQLASVLFAASSTTDVCSRFLSSTTGLGCMSLVSLLQLSVGVVIPSLMVSQGRGASPA